MNTKINQIITALFELEAKECHRTFFEYGNGLFRVKIINRETEKVVYEKTVNVAEGRKTLKKILLHVIAMRSFVLKVPYQCYRREFVEGIKSGEWEKTKSIIEFGKNATASMQIDGQGYFIDDCANGLQYYVDIKQLSDTQK